MATFQTVILKHHRRRDGKYPVSIRVTHNRSSAYISTGYYVDKSQMSKHYELRDNLILMELSGRIDEYERKAVKLGKRMQKLTAKELMSYLTAENDMDFLDFFSDYISKLTTKKTTVCCYKTCFNHLWRFKSRISISDIDNDFLTLFLSFLQENGTGKRGQQLYLTLLKAVFTAAQKKHRKETGEVVDDAFEDFVIPSKPTPQKRNISAEKVRALYDFKTDDDRMIFARDVFMISFLLCGTNTIDLYNLEKHVNGRLSYRRSKTKDRRKDEAFVSYRIEPELQPFLERYAGKEKAFDFSERYQNHISFNKSVRKWLKFFVVELDLPNNFSPYYARHSWATIARNRCGISKDDISAALNHSTRVVTDDYIELDNSIIDNANRKVIDFVFG